MEFVKRFFVFYSVGGCILLISLYSCASKKNISKSEHNSNKAELLAEKYSTLLGVKSSDISNIALYSFIDKWYGTPYKYGGESKNGIDCSSFVTLLYKEVYNKTISGPSGTIFNQCSVASKNNLKEGDLVFFKIEKNKISHVGVYLQNNQFVHASTKKGVRIDNLNTTYYTTYFYKGACLK
ncbi:MAG: C40 family peptidase [Bacteroidia bacterium]